MSSVLIFYGTTDGHTHKVARYVAQVLGREGIGVELVHAGTQAPSRPVAAYDGVIVAASVHISNYQQAVHRWVRENAAALRSRPTAFLSVCLAILEQDSEAQRDLNAIRDRFFDETGWRPTVFKAVAGAMPFTRYNWLKRVVMQRIGKKALGTAPDTSRDYEYTDWEDLTRFARQFAIRVGKLGAPVMAG